MEVPTDTKTCASCGATTMAETTYCSHCGQRLDPTTQRTPPKSKWYYNVWFVLFILTPIVLGPFGLPLLWKSPNFSRTAKLTWTAVTMLWTGLFIWYVMLRVVPAVTNEFQQLNSVLQF